MWASRATPTRPAEHVLAARTSTQRLQAVDVLLAIGLEDAGALWGVGEDPTRAALGRVVLPVPSSCFRCLPPGASGSLGLSRLNCPDLISERALT